MASSIVRLGPLAYVKHSYFPKNLSKCIYLSYQEEFKGMRPLNLFLLRSFSTCNTQKSRPIVCCKYVNCRQKALSRYNVSPKNHKPTWKVGLHTGVSYSSCIESSADYLFYQNLSEANSTEHPEEAVSQTLNKNNLFQDELASFSSIPSANVNQKLQDERGSILASFWECVQPVSPSSDDIEIENSRKNPQAEPTSSRKMDSSLPFPSPSFVLSYGEMLPPAGCSSFLQSTENLKDKTPTNVKLIEKSPEEKAWKQSVLHCSPPEAMTPAGEGSPNELEKPSKEHLVKIYNKLSKELPQFFVKPLDYKIYSPDIVFENRIKGTTSVGIFPYIRQASFLRIIGHVKYAFVKFEILKITQHPEDNSIKVRWRIVGISALKSLPMIFTLKTYTMKAALEKMDDWYDGFSIFYVGKDGLIHKHVADKMIPDEELGVLKKPSLAARLAAVIGLAPKIPAQSQTAATSSLDGLSKEKSEPTSSSMKSVVSLMVLGDYLDNVI